MNADKLDTFVALIKDQIRLYFNIINFKALNFDNRERYTLNKIISMLAYYKRFFSINDMFYLANESLYYIIRCIHFFAGYEPTPLTTTEVVSTYKTYSEAVLYMNEHIELYSKIINIFLDLGADMPKVLNDFRTKVRTGSMGATYIMVFPIYSKWKEKKELEEGRQDILWSHLPTDLERIVSSYLVSPEESEIMKFQKSHRRKKSTRKKSHRRKKSTRRKKSR